MTDPLQAWIEALALAGAEWEALHGPGGLVCHHRLHTIPQPVVLCEPAAAPPCVLCPGCGDERPLTVIRIVVVEDRATGC